jgi:hypothetical protein
MAAIRVGDVARIGEFISPDGVAIGHERPVTPREQILRELDKHTGFYCLVLGDGCPEDGFKMDGRPVHVVSYRELLKRGLVSIQREVVIQPEGLFGTLTLNFKEPVEGVSGTYILDFVYLRNRWYWNVAWSE